MPVLVTVNCVVKNDEQDMSTQNCEEVGRSLRLQNSEVLTNLEQKLIHLPVLEQVV